MVLKHGLNSLAEGHPGYIHVITPKYLSFVPDQDEYHTNYTKDASGDEIVQVQVREGLSDKSDLNTIVSSPA